MKRLEIEQFICRNDNYGVLIHDPESFLTAAIDAPDERAIMEVLEAKGWSLDFIFTTHHHQDHVDANLALKQKLGLSIIGPESEKDKIPGIDRTVKDKDSFTFGLFNVEVIATPGHTAGGVSYYIPDAKTVFTADTLFSLGCGRLFECPPPVMFHSLQKLIELPPETAVFCGHEYTESNARFALSVDPDNAALKERAAEVEHLRNNDLPTLPTTIALEMATNPFLRWHDQRIRRNLGLLNASDEEVFAELRKRKDNF